MSLQISLQKTNSTSYIKDRMVVRRFAYDKETQKTKAGKVIFSSNIYKLPDELPIEKINEFNVTNEEHEQFKKAVCDIKEQREKERLNNTLYMARLQLGAAIETLKGRTDGFNVDDIEKTEDMLKELKSELLRHKKNAKKRKS